jgi:hypothetical protein
MISAPIGNVFTLVHTVVNAAGVLTDAATVTFAVKPPMGAKTTGNYTRHTGTGTYEFDFDSTATVGGTHEGRGRRLNPNSAAQCEFYVIAIEHRLGGRSMLTIILVILIVTEASSMSDRITFAFAGTAPQVDTTHAVYPMSLLFRAGDYADKRYAMTPDEIAAAVGALHAGRRQHRAHQVPPGARLRGAARLGGRRHPQRRGRGAARPRRAPSPTTSASSRASGTATPRRSAASPSA